MYHGFGNPVPRPEARRRLKTTSERVLLFFGYIRKYKGLATLLDALALLNSSLDIHLFVVGEFYEPEQPYRDQISRLGLADRVTIRSEYVPNDEVKNYFSAADAVVLPYLSATQSGIAQIAYHFDLPVIGSTAGGTRRSHRRGKDRTPGPA